MNGATLRIALDFDDYRQQSVAYVIRLSEAVIREMKPVDVCSDPMFVLVSGPQAVTEAYYQRQTKIDRERLAKMISEQVTASLMDYMEARDTKNGYRKNDR